MRRLIIAFGIFVCFPVAALAYNETVAAISFNPSRLGAYTYLKVVNTAKLRGGISVGKDQLYISSKGTVALTDEAAQTHQCKVGACSTDNLNTIENIKPLSTVSGACAQDGYACTGATKADTSAIMQSYNAIGAGGPQGNYTMGNPLPSGFVIGNSTQVLMRGGEFVAKGSSIVDEFTPGTALKKLAVEAGKLRAKKVIVTDSVTLGGIKIKKPVAGGWGKYEFVERTTRKSEKVKVLAVKKS